MTADEVRKECERVGQRRKRHKARGDKLREETERAVKNAIASDVSISAACSWLGISRSSVYNEFGIR